MSLFALSQTLAITTHAADNAILALRESRPLVRAQILLAFATFLLIPAGIWREGVIGGVMARCLAEAVKLTVALLMATAMIRRTNGLASILGSERRRDATIA
jgi:hypothetical protein